MTKRRLMLEVGLAVGIVSVTAGITQIAPLLKDRGIALNLGATMAKALEQADIAANNEFRYVHIKVENNQQLAGEQFGNEMSSEMKVWGYNQNARMDITTVSADDNKEHRINGLMLPSNDRGCMAFDGYYECEAWPEINMEPLTDNTTLTINDVRVDDNTLSFWTKQLLPENTQIEFSLGSSGYSDAGNTIVLGQTENKKYYYVVDLKNLGSLTNPEDIDVNTVQFQLEAVQDDNSPALESPVFEWNQTSHSVRQLTTSDLAMAQQAYANKLKADRAAEPSMMDSFLNDGPFSIVKRLRDGKTNLDQPLEQYQVHYNDKTAKRVLYPFPVEYAQSNLERYVEIIIDPATQTIFEYTLLDENKGMVSRVTFLENKIIAADPNAFFTEDYWKNELHLIAGLNPNIEPWPGVEGPDQVEVRNQQTINVNEVEPKLPD